MLHLREHRGATGYTSGNVWHSCTPVTDETKERSHLHLWVGSKGNASSVTMQEPLGYEVDTGECVDIAAMGSTTIKAHQTANQWGYYTGGQGSSSSSSSISKKRVAPTAQQQRIIQQQQPKRQQPATGGTTGGKQARHYTPQIAAAASAARQKEHASMDVDAEESEEDLFENEADAMDEDDQGQSKRGGDEDPPDDDSNEAGDELPPQCPSPRPERR